MRNSAVPQPTAPAGFTLVETLIAIVLMGMIIAIVTPRIRSTEAKLDVRSARAAVANLYARTRIVAIQQRKPATLRFNGNRVWITVPLGAGLDTIGAVSDLRAQFGVTVTAGGDIPVQPTGLVNLGGPVTIRVTKWTHADSVRITGYGRIE